MKHIRKNGWFRVKALFDGVKYEITLFDGVNIYCENIRCSSLPEAWEYCKERIDAA